MDSHLYKDAKPFKVNPSLSFLRVKKRVDTIHPGAVSKLLNVQDSLN